MQSDMSETHCILTAVSVEHRKVSVESGVVIVNATGLLLLLFLLLLSSEEWLVGELNRGTRVAVRVNILVLVSK